MDLSKESTICLKCKNFICTKFTQSNNLKYKCLINNDLFLKVREEMFYDSDRNPTKLPVIEECNQFIEREEE